VTLIPLSQTEHSDTGNRLWLKSVPSIFSCQLTERIEFALKSLLTVKNLFKAREQNCNQLLSVLVRNRFKERKVLHHLTLWAPRRCDLCLATCLKSGNIYPTYA